MQPVVDAWSDQTLAGQTGQKLSTKEQHNHSEAQLSLTVLVQPHLESSQNKVLALR